MTTAPLTEQQLDEITARTDAATKGPWGFYDGDTYADVAADLEMAGHGSYSYREKVARLEDENYWDDEAHEEHDEERAAEQMAANAAFIAAARTDVPLLLAEVRRLRTELERHTEDVAFLERTTLPELRREIEHHKDGKQRWRDRAEKAEAMLDRFRRIASRLANHAVGFQDVLDDSDRDPWAKTVGADVAELAAALRPDAAPAPATAPLTASHGPAGDRDGETGAEGAAGSVGGSGGVVVETDAIHLHFGLTYANYLVIPRTLLQSMDDEWQTGFVAFLDRLNEAFAHVPQAKGYKVEAATEHEVGDLDEQQLAQLGITEDWYRGETPPDGLSPEDLAEWEAEHEDPEGPAYSRDGEELDRHQRVLIPAADPIPHYDRGRTRIEPAGGHR